jgi:protease I
MRVLEGRRILYIIAQRNFRDEELEIPKRMLEAEGAAVTVASISQAEAIGMFGLRVTPDVAVRQANPADYDGLVVAGGSGSPQLADYPEVLDIIRRFREQDKPIAAICLAPHVLARAGVLRGVTVTTWPADFVLAQLRRAGAVYTEERVVRDGKIITARGPTEAEEFARQIISVLSE